MKKKTEQRRPRLGLEKQTIRALGDGKLAQVAGGMTGDTTSYTTSLSHFIICTTMTEG